jgi:hypothetical protein
MRAITTSQLLCLLFLGLLSGCQCEQAVCFESPTTVDRLEIRDQNNRVLWRLIGDGKHRIQDVTWAIVPAGYSQTIPISGVPRPLRTGEPLLLLWKGDGHFTRHWGEAATGNVIHYGAWVSEPIKGRQDAQLFVDEPNSIDISKGYPRE